MAPQPSKDSPEVQERRREQRERIMAAALGLFARRGFHRTSMHQIADEVQLSVGSLYQYFANKDAIIVEATLVKDRTSEASIAEVGDAKDLAAKMAETLRSIGEGSPEVAALNCEIFAEGARNPVVAERVGDQLAGARTMLAQALQATNPELSAAGAETRAELFVAIQIGLGVLHATRAPFEDLAEIGDLAMPLIVPSPPDEPAASPDHSRSVSGPADDAEAAEQVRP